MDSPLGDKGACERRPKSKKEGPNGGKSTNPFVVVSIDGSTSERNGGSRGGRDHRRNVDGEGLLRLEQAAVTSNPAGGTEKELQPVSHGLSRECSYDFPLDKRELETRPAAAKEEEDHKKTSIAAHEEQLDQSCKKTTRRAAAAGSSFDFGVSVDPPTQLIGSFLQRQRERVLRHTGMLGRLEEEDDPLKDVDVPDRYRSQKWNYLIFLEFVAFVMIVGALVCSTVVPHLRRHVTLWGLNLWRWVVLALVIVCGRLVSSWIIRVVVFFLEQSFLLRKKVLYFVYGLRRGVQNCLWLSFVVLAWHFVFDPRVQQATKVLIYVNKVLQCLLIAVALAMVKTLLVKVLASCFHVDTYFERIRDSLYNQYLLETLSGPPLFKAAAAASQSSIAAALQQQKLENEIAGLRNAGAVAPGLKKKSGFIGRGSGLGGGGADDDYNSKNKNKKCETISIEELNKLSRKNISAWNMKRLVKLVKHTGVVTLADNIHDDVNNGETEVNSEWQAKIAAKQIFKNVAKPGCKFIDKDDLLQFVSEEEVTHVLALFDAAVESEKITAQALMNWTVNVYKERRALALSLCDTKTAVNKLHRFINALMFMIVIVIWLLVLDIATTHLILFLSSQLLLIVFVFGNTCKQIFEAIIFLFVMHPFDVGDRCVIDGNQLVVEEMNILTTVFLGDADVKIWYPNSVLATKPIQNFYRSPDMGDNFDFIVAASTPAEKIAQLKERIGRYIQCKSNHWKPDFCLIILDIVEMHQLLLSLGLTHTINHQDFGEKMSRKSDLLWEMKKIFEDLHIDYHLQPQDIILHTGTNNFPITCL
ncbi:unnamed protein product [Sphagnum troendelagicum]|uniref:Mechanosensitive ion channel protein n=1 Tax=Sphagnum troendelagicum TaxID=128251 RepID=A0ABP0TJD6_9BRYO